MKVRYRNNATTNDFRKARRQCTQRCRRRVGKSFCRNAFEILAIPFFFAVGAQGTKWIYLADSILTVRSRGTRDQFRGHYFRNVGKNKNIDIDNRPSTVETITVDHRPP
jgi:hypothetical protein